MRLRYQAVLTVAYVLAAAPAHAGVFDCAGDCGGDWIVTVDEIVTAVNIALGEASVAACGRADFNDDEQVGVDEVLSGVINLLGGCGDAGLLASGIQFVPESADGGTDRTRLLRIGQDLIFTDGSDTPVKALHLPTRRVRPLVRRMGVPGGFALRDGVLFWTESRSGIAPSGCAGAGVIRVLNRTAIDQTDSVTLGRADDCADATGDVILGAQHVYWVSSLGANDVRILQTPVAGGTTTIVRSTAQSIEQLAGDDTHLYWLETSIQPGVDGLILRQRFDGGAPEVVFDRVHYLGERQGGFTVAAGFVFFGNPSSGTSYEVTRVAVGGSAADVLAEVEQVPRGFAVSGQTLYWIDEDSVHAVAISGGPALEIATDLDAPVAISAAAGGVVWSESRCCAHGQKGRVKFFAPPGPARTLVEAVDSPGAVISDGASAFWGEGGLIGLSEGFGRIATIPLAGGGVRTLAQGVSVALPSLATEGVSVFVADRFRIKRLALTGGPAQALAAGDFFVAALAADQRSVYWAEDPSLIRRIPVAGGAVDDLATGAGPARAMAVDTTHVYWSEGLGSINRVPVDGGQAETVASGLAGISDLVVEPGAVFFSEQDSGGIFRLDPSSGAIVNLALGLPFSWNYLALDPASVYWINQEHLARVPKVGGATTILASELDSRVDLGNAVLVDAEAVYWTEVGAGTVRALPR